MCGHKDQGHHLRGGQHHQEQVREEEGQNFYIIHTFIYSLLPDLLLSPLLIRFTCPLGHFVSNAASAPDLHLVESTHCARRTEEIMSCDFDGCARTRALPDANLVRVQSFECSR